MPDGKGFGGDLDRSRSGDVNGRPVAFTALDEPYLGRSLLFHFDQLITSVLEQNAVTAPRSHGAILTDNQLMAAQTIAQALSITLSIRELIRQGYLFGGHILVRPMVERTSILLYLHLYPAEIDKWNHGWHQHEAPSLSKMLDAIRDKWPSDSRLAGRELTTAMNSLAHGKPDSGPWNMVSLADGNLGHAVSRILDRPDLCDALCADVIPWVVVVQGMMAAYFPHDPSDRQLRT